MKTEVASVLASVFVLFISFQNCQKPPYPDELNSSNINAYSNRKDLGIDAVQTIILLVPATQSVIKAGNTYQINYNKLLSINVNTGILTESSDVSATTAQYCLNIALKNELISILKSSQVCTKQPVLPAGTMCSQVLKLPYAQLITANSQYNLGSASDGCGSNSVDLCDEQSVILKGFIEAIKNQYQEMSCS